ncbi:erythromycin esterase family protein [Brevibacillus fulvus]|uniref:Erythromycin esterase-like protein n=1 Tax=Brevibacillus fulvus TaxID=1125967 RepID=A0A939BSV7_9BACL|nr:erythromycin esterase family protein [Brevibacillus fulvus]MBM7588889.1 erythromycin esterase-like protein [Brevibacillus fulvus]
MDKKQWIAQIQRDAFTFEQFDCTPLVNAIGEAKLVLLGEATHGTSEFYTIRAEITRTLIEQKQFSFIAVEGDWPSCYVLNQYVKGYLETEDVEEVLQAFNRWPTWMWANREIAELAKWLRAYNAGLADEQKVGFYGLDVYSLWESIDEIMRYLKKTNSPELETAKKVFSCFEPYQRDGQEYGISAAYFSSACEEEVVQLLLELQQKKRWEQGDREAALNMELNALVARNAEQYYRAMVQGGPQSWNIRDIHMVEVINRLLDFHGKQAKGIIWEHNTHIGDARATDMAEEGEINVGQLLREQYAAEEVFAVGFGTYRGTVIAARGWGEPLQRMQVPPAQTNSWEDMLHEAGPENKLILFSENREAYRQQAIGHRAIGVVYFPEDERGNYVPTILSMRYDAFVYVEQTNALTPLVVEPVLV